MMRGFISSRALAASAATIMLLLAPKVALSHCDTLDGPVAKDVVAALDAKDVMPVLKWVSAEQEAELKDAFNASVNAADMGGAAKELARRYFMETAIRLHRASEGEPYTGLKPAGSEQSPVVVGADKALETGSMDGLAALITDSAVDGLRKRFQRAAEARKHMGGSVEAGREYVKAYVEYVHYAERLYNDATAGHAHGAAEDIHHAH